MELLFALLSSGGLTLELAPDLVDAVNLGGTFGGGLARGKRVVGEVSHGGSPVGVHANLGGLVPLLAIAVLFPDSGRDRAAEVLLCAARREDVL